MSRFVSGPRGLYNIAFVKRVYSVRDGRLYADLSDDESVQLYAPELTAIETDDPVVPGNGVVVEFWGVDIWRHTNIIAWRLDLTSGYHHPLCLDQVDVASNSFWAVEDLGGRWVQPGEQTFATFDEFKEEANAHFRRLEQQEAEAAEKLKQQLSEPDTKTDHQH